MNKITQIHDPSQVEITSSPEITSEERANLKPKRKTPEQLFSRTRFERSMQYDHRSFEAKLRAAKRRLHTTISDSNKPLYAPSMVGTSRNKVPLKLSYIINIKGTGLEAQSWQKENRTTRNGNDASRFFLYACSKCKRGLEVKPKYLDYCFKCFSPWDWSEWRRIKKEATKLYHKNQDSRSESDKAKAIRKLREMGHPAARQYDPPPPPLPAHLDTKYMAMLEMQTRNGCVYSKIFYEAESAKLNREQLSLFAES
jgi:hypothetical protein